MVAFNNTLGFVFFNCPHTFLIYLGFATGIKIDYLIDLFKHSKFDVVTSELS